MTAGWHGAEAEGGITGVVSGFVYLDLLSCGL